MIAKIGLAALAVCAVVLGAIILFAPDVEVRLSEEQVAEEIEKRLPITLRKLGVELIVREATVDFLEQNAVHVVADLDIEGFGLSGSAKADTVSGIRYQAGNFYLSDLTIERMEITPDVASDAAISDTATVAGGLFNSLRSRLEEETDGAGGALDRMKERALERFRPAVREGVDSALQSIPIYSLNNRDIKHDLAALALREVRFDGSAATIVLDPSQAALKIATAIVTGLFVLIVLVLMVRGIAWR